METHLEIVNFLEAHIELVKVFMYALSPIVAICFRDFRAVVIRFLNGIYFLLALPVKSFLLRHRRRNLRKQFAVEVGDLPVSTQRLLFRFAVERQYIEITDVSATLRDILILHDKGWIHGLSDAIPYTICISLNLLPFVKGMAEQKCK